MTRILDFKSDPPGIAYLDPSFLVNFYIANSRFHSEVKAYSKRLQQAGTILVLSNLSLDEIWFALLKVFALRDYGPKQGYRKLTSDPDIVRGYATELEKITTQILELPHLFTIEITTDQTIGALEIVKNYGLMPRDAIHANAALVSGVNAIITTDADFARVGELVVYTCNPEAFKQ